MGTGALKGAVGASIFNEHGVVIVGDAGRGKVQRLTSGKAWRTADYRSRRRS